jgi:hypothetical protein
LLWLLQLARAPQKQEHSELEQGHLGLEQGHLEWLWVLEQVLPRPLERLWVLEQVLPRPLERLWERLVFLLVLVLVL